MTVKSKRISNKPSWLKRKLPTGPDYEQVRRLMKKSHLHTVCQEAMCPNVWECFSQKTATFLIMGPNCTRTCSFCAVSNGNTHTLDPAEPQRIASAVKQMNLSYVVVTSVTRDDLSDGGAGHFSETISAIKNRVPNVRVEVLIPDFQGDIKALERVVSAQPDVINHNIETCPRLYHVARKEASYERSLNLLGNIKKTAPSIPAKSGMMLGLGETEEEILSVFKDLLITGCSILTIGQYLQPSRKHLPVKAYIPPEEFDRYKQAAIEMGFKKVASGPLVRSSYQAHKFFSE